MDLLPPLMNASGEVDSALLREIGIPSAVFPQLIQVIQKSHQEARQLRGTTAQSLRYELDKPVEIVPLSEQEISTLLERFKSEAYSITGVGSGVEKIEPLLRRRLEKEFGKPIWVTLKRSDALSLSHHAHTSSEYFGMIFEVKRTKEDGSEETLTVDPVQNESSEFFYLNLKR